MRDLQDRLTKANDIIEKLTEELRDAKKDKDGMSINSLLQKMREQMMCEFLKYKKVRKTYYIACLFLYKRNKHAHKA